MLRIGVVGDYQPGNETHLTIASAMRHTGVPVHVQWIATTDVRAAELRTFDGLWCAPGSPFRCMEGALAVIGFARENNVPFLGTCAGFQHAVIEFARAVLHIEDATSEEYDEGARRLFVSRLACSLVGKEMPVSVDPESLAFRAYGSRTAVEKYYCNFGLNPAFELELTGGGMRVSGRDAEGGARIIELPTHPCFIATLFVPQTSSTEHSPHRLITFFTKAALARSRET